MGVHHKILGVYKVSPKFYLGLQQLNIGLQTLGLGAVLDVYDRGGVLGTVHNNGV